VRATQEGNADYYAFIWTGAIAPFSASPSVVANSGIFSQAVTVNVGAGGGGPRIGSFSANPTTVSASAAPPETVTFTVGAIGGTMPYTYTIDPGDGTGPIVVNSPATTATHDYTTPSGPGGYDASMTVTDAAAGSDTPPTVKIIVNP
jgi:hypothetical protein